MLYTPNEWLKGLKKTAATGKSATLSRTFCCFAFALADCKSYCEKHMEALHKLVRV